MTPFHIWYADINNPHEIFTMFSSNKQNPMEYSKQVDTKHSLHTNICMSI